MVKKAPKAVDAGAPSRPKSGFFLYADAVRKSVTADIRAKLEAAGGKFSIVAVGKQISEQWKDVSEEKKNEYAAQYKTASETYKPAYAAWLKSAEGQQYNTDLSNFKKQKADAEAKEKLFAEGYPKKPQSGYFAFSGEVTQAVIAELEAENKPKTTKERVGKIKERWDALGKEGQAPYAQRYEDAKAEYLEKKKDFETNNEAYLTYDATLKKNKAAHAKRLNKDEPSAKRRKLADRAEPAAEESPVDEEDDEEADEEESPEEDEEESPEE